jgi:hypothetical protein
MEDRRPGLKSKIGFAVLKNAAVGGDQRAFVLVVRETRWNNIIQQSG